MSFKIQSNDPGYELVTKGPLRIHRESMTLTTSTLLILCHVLQKMSEKCTKNRGARAEPSLLLMIPFANDPFCFWTCFGITRESFNKSLSA